MRSIVSGVLGGLVSILLISYIAKRVGRGGERGQLRYGPFLWGLACVCLAFAVIPITLVTYQGRDDQLPATLFLLAMFGFFGVYCLAEAAFVRGEFDDEGISFATPWTGAKHEAWRDLVSIEFVPSCGWYALSFESGERIRLSTMLDGHLLAVERALQQLGIADEHTA